jgi:dihydrofolate reductase
MERFTAILGGKAGERPTVELPFDARERFGRVRAPVRGTVNGTPFQTTVAVYGGRQLIGFRKELREAAGVAIGDRVTIELELDDTPRTVELPRERNKGGHDGASRRAAPVSLTQYYTATTLDGFIADPNNSLEWLFTRQHEADGLLNYGRFMTDVGALAMGSTTYEWILDHEFAGKDPAEWKWPYEIPCWVFTHRQLTVVPDAQVEFRSGDVVPVHEQMVAAAGDRNIWIVGGGDLAGQFADEGLLDEVLVTIAPVTLGGGAPLLPRRLELRLEEVGRNGDFACARFSVVHPAA